MLNSYRPDPFQRAALGPHSGSVPACVVRGDFIVPRTTASAFALWVRLVPKTTGGWYTFIFPKMVHFSFPLKLLEHHPKGKIKLLYIYPDNKDRSAPAFSALSGFTRTVFLENSNFMFKTVGVDHFDNKIWDIVLSELDTDGLEVHYKGEKRYISQIKEFRPADRTDKIEAIALREKGVYIITGGMGGLGLIFAEYLSQEAKARLVLIGRSALSEEKALKIKELKSSGSDVIYMKADVTNREEVLRVVKHAKEEFGEINGIIHAAGINRDSIISKKTTDQFKLVIAPKVYGTVYLDEATKKENLSFFVMFSSVAAMLGNPGQSDYAYANCFMDNFAITREDYRSNQKRSGKTLSINWPLWQSGGMNVDEPTLKMMETTTGMKPLSTKTGLSAFSKGLQLNLCRFTVVEGHCGKIRKKLGLDDSEEKKDMAVSSPQIKADEKELLEKTKKDLVKIVSAILKVDERDLDLDEDLQGYGFESITLTAFINTINERYGLEISPAAFFGLDESTISFLAKYLCKEHKSKLITYYYDKLKKIDFTEVLEQVEIQEPQLKSRFQSYFQAPSA